MTMGWLERTLQAPRRGGFGIKKDQIKPLGNQLVKSLDDVDIGVRNSTAVVFACLLVICGERMMGTFFEALDNVRKTKVKESTPEGFTAKVKGKKAAKPAPAKKAAPSPTPTASPAKAPAGGRGRGAGAGAGGGAGGGTGGAAAAAAKKEKEEREKRERERMEKDLLEKEKKEKEKREKEKLEREKQERQREERERQEKQREERQKAPQEQPAESGEFEELDPVAVQEIIDNVFFFFSSPPYLFLTSFLSYFLNNSKHSFKIAIGKAEWKVSNKLESKLSLVFVHLLFIAQVSPFSLVVFPPLLFLFLRPLFLFPKRVNI